MMTYVRDNLKNYIKQRPFLYKAALSFRRFTFPCIHRFHFVYMMMTKLAYFGPVLNAWQCNRTRQPIMRKLITQELEKAGASYKILEIGAWAGHSTTLWASVCMEKGKGKVFCIDTWKGSDNTPQLRNKTRKIFNLFVHNIRVSGLEDYAIPMKGSSDTIAQILQANTFDFVYIDGDHAYSQFKRDLFNYMKVVKTGGIICGDDLELLLNETDISFTKTHCEEDYVMDPQTKKFFHPGITLGISEVFGNDISMKDGFWGMRKGKDGWELIRFG